MAERITPRSKDFSEWYQDIVVQAKLADYSPVKGCMVIRPNGYGIWENIQSNFNDRIKKLGVRNAYFPVFIPESFINKEKEHVEGFAPECAVVTSAGGKDLEEKLIVRPTSETIINSMFSKWIQSYRDLPMLVNQWANVVRWEMRTRLFLRTTEFLWQEGHTCHATADEAEDFTRRMLFEYESFAHEVLAMPVTVGLKSDKERFAGALRTYCIEAMMQDKKALQAGTSHNLSTHFSKAFNTQFLNSGGKQEFVHQTSWGVSTRLVGGVIMTHSDDKGLVLPPRLATTHVVIVPIFKKNDPGKGAVIEAAEKLAEEIRNQTDTQGLGFDLRVDVDADENKQPGWKFHEYELIGIPVRIELGPRDLEKKQAVFTRRDIGKKEFLPLNELPARVIEELPKMQSDLLEKAKRFKEENTVSVKTYDEMKEKLNADGGFVETDWDPESDVEDRLKDDVKATLRCILLDEQGQPRKSKNGLRAIFAKSY